MANKQLNRGLLSSFIQMYFPITKNYYPMGNTIWSYDNIPKKDSEKTNFLEDFEFETFQNYYKDIKGFKTLASSLAHSSEDFFLKYDFSRVSMEETRSAKDRNVKTVLFRSSTTDRLLQMEIFVASSTKNIVRIGIVMLT
jgi:hypothetical protein